MKSFRQKQEEKSARLRAERAEQARLEEEARKNKYFEENWGAEARKIKEPYVSKKDRKKVLSKSRRAKNLYQSELNILLGVHYLNGLLNRFNDTVLTLSAYNAGPTVTKRWLEKYSIQDLFYFIEKVPYKETRNYIKLILRNYFYYKRWYTSNPEYQHLDSIAHKVLAVASLKEKAIR